MEENNSYTVELIRIDTRNIPRIPPITKEDDLLMEQYKEVYRIHLFRSAMGGNLGIHKTIENDNH